jgi:hypothetical protein
MEVAEGLSSYMGCVWVGEGLLVLIGESFEGLSRVTKGEGLTCRVTPTYVYF